MAQFSLLNVFFFSFLNLKNYYYFYFQTNGKILFIIHQKISFYYMKT